MEVPAVNLAGGLVCPQTCGEPESTCRLRADQPEIMDSGSSCSSLIDPCLVPSSDSSNLPKNSEKPKVTAKAASIVMETNCMHVLDKSCQTHFLCGIFIPPVPLKPNKQTRSFFVTRSGHGKERIIGIMAVAWQRYVRQRGKRASSLCPFTKDGPVPKMQARNIKTFLRLTNNRICCPMRSFQTKEEELEPSPQASLGHQHI